MDCLFQKASYTFRITAQTVGVAETDLFATAAQIAAGAMDDLKNRVQFKTRRQAKGLATLLSAVCLA